MNPTSIQIQELTVHKHVLNQIIHAQASSEESSQTSSSDSNQDLLPAQQRNLKYDNASSSCEQLSNSMTTRIIPKLAFIIWNPGRSLWGWHCRRCWKKVSWWRRRTLAQTFCQTDYLSTLIPSCRGERPRPQRSTVPGLEAEAGFPERDALNH